MQFRDKTAQHLREELEALAQWGVDMVYMADNIMPLNYLRNLFPALALIEPQIKLFYEVKANLSTANIDVLKRGGVVSIQPGIESLSSDVLKLMRKGVSAHQNVALLRDSRGAGLTVHWGIIYGFPGEAAAHYEAMIGLMPKIEHLQPPNGAHRIIIDRFSPFFRDPRGTGINEVSPIEGYRALYPSEVDTADIAYHFDGHYSTALLENPDLLGRLLGAVEAWKAAWISKPVAVLELFERGGGALVLDTRSASRQPVTKLTIEQHDALIALERPHKRAALDPALAAETDWLIEKGFIIDYEDILISIVVRPRKREDELAPQQSGHTAPIPLASQDAQPISLL
jgi:ribosomal peptide maturation radical SAM protein 1